MYNFKNLLTRLLMPFFLQPQIAGLPLFGSSPFMLFAEGDDNGNGGGASGDDSEASKGSDKGDKGSGAADGQKTGGEFDESIIPEAHRKAFEKYQQSLIDKGVDIGIGRQKSVYEKSKGKEVDAFLKEQNLSKEDIEALKPILAKKGSLNKLFEAYQTEDLDEIVALISEAEKGELTEVERLQQELDEAAEREVELMERLEALQQGFDEAGGKKTEREQKLFSSIENLLVANQLRQQAIRKNAFDPEDVVLGLKSMIKVVEGEDGSFSTQVLDPKKPDHPRLNKRGDLFTIEELVDEYLTARPHLRKSNLSGGAGSSGGAGKKDQGESAKQSAFTKEQLKDPTFVQKNFAKIQEAIRKGEVSI